MIFAENVELIGRVFEILNSSLDAKGNIFINVFLIGLDVYQVLYNINSPSILSYKCSSYGSFTLFLFVVCVILAISFFCIYIAVYNKFVYVI